MVTSFIPAQFQPDLPLNELIVFQRPGEEAIQFDVVFVGGGPAGLAGAIELARLVRKDQLKDGKLGHVEIGVFEKASTLGEHTLSGAIVDPKPLLELFPELSLQEFPFYGPVLGDRVFLLTEKTKIRFPTPSSMRNAGNYYASICELVRWMGEKASELGVNIFTGFPVGALLAENNRILGVRTVASGLDREGKPTSSYLPPTDVSAPITILAEGTRGSLTQAYLKWQAITSANPQIYALGVKELWETTRVPDTATHTLGWPLSRDTFGGSWIYPMGKNLISFGLVVGLDYRPSQLDIHELLQQFKRHPILRDFLREGKIVEWGGKTIPEGGYYSVPDRLSGNGLMIIGDSAGLVNVASLKGIHYAIQSGMFAGRAAFNALKLKDPSTSNLTAYDEMIRASFIQKDLYRTRNMRLAFKSGLFKGGIRASLMSLSSGRLFGKRIKIQSDAEEVRLVPSGSKVSRAKGMGLSKEDAVFYSGNVTRDDVPSHLIVGKDLIPEIAEFYEHMCPAGVYERVEDRLGVSPANCIDCKATDILGPRWTSREGGSGPRYRRM